MPDSLSPSEYLAQRVDDQINWYDRRSGWNQRWFKLLRIIEIIAAALIPLLTAIPTTPETWYVKYVIGAIGVLITIVAGILALYQFQERWTEYRATAESLKKERYLFVTHAEPYAAGNIFSAFVQNIETLISKENTKWVQSSARPPQVGPGGGG